MNNKSIFYEEWRRCLEAHYQAVVRRDDRLTERSLRHVMLKVGFSEEAMRQLYLEATMHVDDVPPGFLPSMPSATQPVEPASFSLHPAECTCPACVAQVDTLRHDEEGQPRSADEQQEALERAAWEQEQPATATHVQRSLF